MKKTILFMSGFFLTISVTAQVCFLSPRGMADLPLDEPAGYVGGLEIDIPGDNVPDKADSCLARLFEQFDTELAGIVVTERIVGHTAVCASVRYKQLIDDMLVDDHGIYFRFDAEGRLSGVNINLALDPGLQSELEDLAALGIPGKQKIVFTLNGYELKDVRIPHLHATCTENGIEGSNLQVSFPPYTSGCRENLAEFAIPMAFSTGNPLHTISTNKLCGKYANPASNPTFQNGSGASYWWYDCETTTNKHEALMAYYHLNFALDYINETMVPFGPPVQNVLFDYASGDQADVPVVELTANGNEIRFSVLPTGNGYNDIAEDADHVAGAAFEAYMAFNNIPIPIGASEGVGVGTIAYWTWRYMVDQGHGHTNIGKWAGSDHIEITLNNTLKEEDFVLLENRLNASVWAGALYEIHEIFLTGGNEGVMYELMMNAMLDWGGNMVTQKVAAMGLYDLAVLMTPTKISEKQLCGIRKVLTDRYESLTVFFNPNRDLYIKDTHAGVAIPGGGVTGEDRGVEVNDVGGLYDKSPNIWNCTTSTCNEHQRPVVGVTNYLKVLVSNEGCDWPELEGKLEAYAAFVPVNERWPYDWGATDANNDGTPEYTYYYYGGTNVVVGKRIGSVDLDTYTENENGRIYTINWIPWQPFGANKPWSPQLSFLVRILDASEPFKFSVPENDLAFNYVRDNNNVARRKNSVYLFATGGPNPTPHVIVGPMLGGGGFQGESHLALSYTTPGIIHTAVNFDSLGTISMIFPSNLLRHYGLDLPDETGFDWVNDSIIEITSPDFYFPLKWNPDSIYQLQIKYTPTVSFQPVSFYLELRDEEDCSFGGEHFTINATGTAPRSNDDELLEGQDAILFPNPAIETVHVRLPGDATVREIRVFNSLGQSFTPSFNRPEQSFAIAEWPDGIYYTLLTLSDGSKTSAAFIKLCK